MNIKRMKLYYWHLCDNWRMTLLISMKILALANLLEDRFELLLRCESPNLPVVY